MKKPVFNSIFANLLVKPIVSKDKDKYLSEASIKELQKFLPEINVNENSDLLPISFNACVVNRVNKNKDVITTATALQIYKTFIYKNINVEHDRHKALGVILTAGFSEFGTDKPLTEEEVKDLKSPFNITLGGVVWKVVNEDIASLIEDCSDPSSDNYLKISASWELGFSDYELILIKGDSKNTEDGRIVKDKTEIENLKSNLTAYGGTGKINEEYVYRCPSEGVLALGIGLTNTPAADVQGIAVASTTSQTATNNNVIVVNKTESEQKEIKSEVNISQDEIKDVKVNITDMKLTSVKDITDESLKTIKASAVVDFIEEEIKKIDKAYVAEKESKESDLKANKDSLAKAEKDLNDTKKELVDVKAELNKIQTLIAEKQNEELFTQRMTEFDAEYILDDEDRSTLASDIKGMDENSFAAFKKKAAVFLKNRKKGNKVFDPKTKKWVDPDAADEPKASKASTTKEETKEVIESAIDKAKVETPAVTSSQAAQEPTLKERWAKAFAPENVLIKNR